VYRITVRSAIPGSEAIDVELPESVQVLRITAAFRLFGA